MHPSVLIKFKFRVRTRDGVVVANLFIAGRDLADAERKVRQIYRDCEILDREVWSSQVCGGALWRVARA